MAGEGCYITLLLDFRKIGEGGMKSKDTEQLDLFEWGDRQPTADVLDFMRPLSLAIQHDPDRFDPMVPKPRYDDSVVEWPGKPSYGTSHYAPYASTRAGRRPLRLLTTSSGTTATMTSSGTVNFSPCVTRRPGGVTRGSSRRKS